MNLGFFTTCMPDISFEEKIEWAGQAGFRHIEFGAWPEDVDGKEFVVHDLDANNISDEKITKIKELLNKNNVNISCISYYENTLTGNVKEREKIIEYLYRCIDLAAKLGCPMVGTFVGRDIYKSVEENLDEFERIFAPILSYADEKNIKVIFENCVMDGWQITGIPGTLCYTPELWEELFKRVPNKNFGINFDPSHLIKQMIDIVPLLHAFKERIFHVHLKDTIIDESLLRWYGVYNRQIGYKHKNGFWKSAIPGGGGIDWRAFLRGIKEIGYEGVLSIENEDTRYLDSTESAKQGLLKTREFIISEFESIE